MVKYLVILGLGWGLVSANLLDKECVACHIKNGPDLESVYFRYLQIYGSEHRAQVAMYRFLTHPDPQLSIMPEQVLKRFGLHPVMDPDRAKVLLPFYYQRFNVKTRLHFSP